MIKTEHVSHRAPVWSGRFYAPIVAAPLYLVHEVSGPDVTRLRGSEVKDARLTALGTQPAGGPSDAFEHQVKDDFAYCHALIQQANVKMD